MDWRGCLLLLAEGSRLGIKVRAGESELTEKKLRIGPNLVAWVRLRSTNVR